VQTSSALAWHSSETHRKGKNSSETRFAAIFSAISPTLTALLPQILASHWSRPNLFFCVALIGDQVSRRSRGAAGAPRRLQASFAFACAGAFAGVVDVDVTTLASPAARRTLCCPLEPIALECLRHPKHVSAKLLLPPFSRDSSACQPNKGFFSQLYTKLVRTSGGASVLDSKASVKTPLALLVLRQPARLYATLVSSIVKLKYWLPAAQLCSSLCEAARMWTRPLLYLARFLDYPSTFAFLAACTGAPVQIVNAHATPLHVKKRDRVLECSVSQPRGYKYATCALPAS
jgi:hypothetical protein